MKISVKTELPQRCTVVRIREAQHERAATMRLRDNEAQLILYRTPSQSHIQWLRMIRQIVRAAREQRIAHIAVHWGDVARDGDDLTAVAQCVAENIVMAAYAFDTYKKRDKEDVPLRAVTLICDTAVRPAVRRGVARGVTVARWVNVARDLANTPGGDLTPALLASRTRSLARGIADVRVRVLTPQQMRAKKMHGVLAVGRGSHATPRFIIVEYRGAKNPKDAPVVLVGKGVTFDSGGLDVKPYPYATDMMMDMSGGAAVIASVLAAAELKLSRNIVALVPAVENMPSGSSFRPGDILRMMDGTTVEVRNTDAEGRLILADALTYAQKYYAPRAIVDVATLTGAALVALGEEASAVMSRDTHTALRDTLVAAGEASGDRAWALPLWDEYDAYLRSDRADIANIASPGRDRYAGTITAGAFLKRFVAEEVPWAHIDMASRMTATKEEALAPGAAGSPVQLLVRYLALETDEGNMRGA